MKSVTSAVPDLTQGGLPRTLWRLAWPATLSQVLFMIPGLYDAIWLGKLGSDAQSAAGLATSARVLLISVLMALSAAGGAVVARYVGAKDQENANLATLQAVILMIVSAGSLGVIGLIFMEPLLRLAGADAEVLPLTVRYARILFSGLIAMEMVPSVGGMMGAAGAPQVRLSMMAWTMGTLLVAEPLLVIWLGLEGAVLALVGAHVVGMVWGLGVLIAGRDIVRIDMHHLRLDFPMMGRILRITGPAIIQRGAPNLAMFWLMRLIAGYGDATLAAWVITSRIFGFVQVPGMGAMQVAAAMVGQNLGAGQPHRAERAVRWVFWTTTGVMVVLLGGAALGAPQVMAWFTQEADSLTAGVYLLRVLSLGYLAQTLTLVFIGALSGAGDTILPMAVNLVSLWLVQIPLALILPGPLRMGENGLWLALGVGWILQAALLGWYYRRGNWKLQKL